MHFNNEVVEVDPGRREALVKDSKNDTKDTLGYDVMAGKQPTASYAATPPAR